MDEILNDREIEVYVKTWTLIPSKGSVFELVVNGELVFSKKALKRHAEPGEIHQLMRSIVAQFQPPTPSSPSE